jgi:hypothetical protein
VALFQPQRLIDSEPLSRIAGQEVHAKPPSHVDDGVAEPMLVVHDVVVESCW